MKRYVACLLIGAAALVGCSDDGGDGASTVSSANSTDSESGAGGKPDRTALEQLVRDERPDLAEADANDLVNVLVGLCEATEREFDRDVLEAQRSSGGELELYEKAIGVGADGAPKPSGTSPTPETPPSRSRSRTGPHSAPEGLPVGSARER